MNSLSNFKPGCPTFSLIYSGDDRSSEGPWASLAGARDGLRRLRVAGDLSGEATVLIEPGRYLLREPVEFGPEDGHTTYIAAGDGVVFDGGERLTGWREEMSDVGRKWVLDLPEIASGFESFRSLFVNGERRPRARFPKFSPDSQGVKKMLQIGAIRYPERKHLFDGDHVFAPKDGDLQDWPSFEESEIVVLHYWIDTRLGRPRRVKNSPWIECARRSVFNLYEAHATDPGAEYARYYVDNLKEALTEPGEWYGDRFTGRVEVLPKEGEVLAEAEIFVPRIDTFVRVRGEAFNRNVKTPHPHAQVQVENLRFEGLTFRHADWFHPQADYLDHNSLRLDEHSLGSSPQGAVHVPATIEFRWTRGCGMTRCTVEHIGLTAIEMGVGTSNAHVAHCVLRDLGGGGVKIDGSEVDGPVADRTSGIRVEDTTITDVGRVFHQSIGILLARAFDCSLRHNHIARCCYTGISCGWSWGSRETITKNNLIENNLIHDIGAGVLSDMGGIYLLGVQPGTVVRGNHVYGVKSASYGGWGIYPDEGSAYIVIEHNWVHDTQGAALGIHFSRELVVRDNVFMGAEEEGVIRISREEGGIVVATLVNNLILGPAPALFQGGYKGDVRKAFRSDGNVFWFDGGTPLSRVADCRSERPVEIPFEEWQAAGLDQNSLVVDPRAQVTEANFVLPLDSPALKAGFRPYDWSQCGPRTCKVERDIMTGAVRSQMAATVSQRCAATLLSEAGIETPQGLETASKCDVGDRGIAENKQPSGLCDSLV